MDASLLSILGTIVQAYASILAIVGMYAVFYRQRKDERIRDTRTRFENKARSLVDFINHEIAPAYSADTVVKVDVQDPPAVLAAIDEYRIVCKNQSVKSLGNENYEKLIKLWSIVDGDKEDLLQIKMRLEEFENVAVPSRSMMLFVGYFIFELVLCFVGIFLIFCRTERSVHSDGSSYTICYLRNSSVRRLILEPPIDRSVPSEINQETINLIYQSRFSVPLSLNVYWLAPQTWNAGINDPKGVKVPYKVR
jgi:hypothetical protein